MYRNCSCREYACICVVSFSPFIENNNNNMAGDAVNFKNVATSPLPDFFFVQIFFNFLQRVLRLQEGSFFSDFFFFSFIFHFLAKPERNNIMTKSPCPRLIFVRHGQTEWSKSGQYTSRTDLDLTPFGVKQMRNTGKGLIGPGNLQMIKPENLTHIFVSPRKRAQRTSQLLLEEVDPEIKDKIPIEIDEDVREWEYGEYEGLKTNEIIELRKQKGLDKDLEWTIWGKGCEGGEQHYEVAARLDRFIEKIQKIHREALAKGVASDIIVVAHGHILRCLVARWVKRELSTNPQLILDAGGVGVLSYQHHNVDEPAIYLAGAFTVPVEEEGADI